DRCVDQDRGDRRLRPAGGRQRHRLGRRRARGGFADVIKIGGPGVAGTLRNLFLIPPSPLEQLKAAFPKAQFEFDPGYTPAEAALTAKRCDVVIAFAIRVEGEGFDSPDLS